MRLMPREKRLLPYIEGGQAKRSKPIAFESDRQLALVDTRFKIYSGDGGESFELYDLVADPFEEKDLSKDDRPEIVKARDELMTVMKSFPADAKLPFEPRKKSNRKRKNLA